MGSMSVENPSFMFSPGVALQPVHWLKLCTNAMRGPTACA